MSENYAETYATTVPDTMVLKVQQVYFEDGKQYLHWTVYLFYDPAKDVFVLRGKRKGGSTFSYECGSADDMGDFVRFITGDAYEWNYCLHNQKQLSPYSDEITYKMLAEGCTFKNLIVDYRRLDYEQREECKYRIECRLRMMRNVFNLNIPGMGMDV